MRFKEMCLTFLCVCFVWAAPAMAQDKSEQISRDEMHSILAYMVGDNLFTAMANRYNYRLELAKKDGTANGRERITVHEGAEMLSKLFSFYHAGNKDAVRSIEEMAIAMKLKLPMSAKISVLEFITQEYLKAYPKYQTK